MQEAIRQTSFLHSLHLTLNGIYTLPPKGRREGLSRAFVVLDPGYKAVFWACDWFTGEISAVRLNFTITRSHWSACLPCVHTKWLHKAILIWGDWIIHYSFCSSGDITLFFVILHFAYKYSQDNLNKWCALNLPIELYTFLKTGFFKCLPSLCVNNRRGSEEDFLCHWKIIRWRFLWQTSEDITVSGSEESHPAEHHWSTKNTEDTRRIEMCNGQTDTPVGACDCELQSNSTDFNRLQNMTHTDKRCLNAL